MPDFTAGSTRQLIANVQSLNLTMGSALVSMLNTVVQKLGPDPTPLGPDPTPLHVLRAFVSTVDALRGRKIAPAAADSLIGTANNIAAGLSIR